MKNVPDIFRKNLTAQEVYELFQRALDEAHRPAEERFLTGPELCKMLSISERTLATWRSTGLIAYHKLNGVFIYILSDVLDMIKQHRVEPLATKLKIKL